MSEAAGNWIGGAASAIVRKHRARVLTPVGSGVDEYGHLRQQSMQITYDQLPCRAWSVQPEAETFTDAVQGAVLRVRMIVARDVDIDDTFIVESISDRRGVEVFKGPLRVIGVTRRADHIAVDLRGISGGRA